MLHASNSLNKSCAASELLAEAFCLSGSPAPDDWAVVRGIPLLHMQLLPQLSPAITRLYSSLCSSNEMAAHQGACINNCIRESAQRQIQKVSLTPHASDNHLHLPSAVRNCACQVSTSHFSRQTMQLISASNQGHAQIIRRLVCSEPHITKTLTKAAGGVHRAPLAATSTCTC